MFVQLGDYPAGSDLLLLFLCYFVQCSLLLIKSLSNCTKCSHRVYIGLIMVTVSDFFMNLKMPDW